MALPGRPLIWINSGTKSLIRDARPHRDPSLDQGSARCRKPLTQAGIRHARGCARRSAARPIAGGEGGQRKTTETPRGEQARHGAGSMSFAMRPRALQHAPPARRGPIRRPLGHQSRIATAIWIAPLVGNQRLVVYFGARLPLATRRQSNCFLMLMHPPLPAGMRKTRAPSPASRLRISLPRFLPFGRPAKFFAATASHFSCQYTTDS